MTKCNDRDCGGSQMEENTQAANLVILESQAGVQACNAGNSNNCSAGTVVANVYDSVESVSNKARSDILKYTSKAYDYLEYLEFVKVPFVSSILDYQAQKYEDADTDYTFYQKEVRAITVASESQITSSLSTAAAELSISATAYSGPGAVATGVITYTGVSITSTAIFASINDQFIFPWINNKLK
jgi:hypothetical protein